MNKKLLLAMALPTVLVGCSQEELVSEAPAVAQKAKAISGVTFTIEKNGMDADTRAIWQDNNTIKFEKDDNVSLYWISLDGLVANNTSGEFDGSATPLTATAPLMGQSNAVFYTEDGSKFESKAVVYEGYNLLVYPANTTHVTNQKVVVSLPAIQKAEDDFTKKLVYVGDSILQIHQPSLNLQDGKYYDMYGEESSVDAPNTSGYQHGIKAGVKLMSSLLKMKFVIENTNATDVKIQKVELTTKGGTEKMFSIEGNIVPSTKVSLTSQSASKAEYINPWFVSTTDGKKASVAVDCSNIKTTQAGTEVQMVLLPVTAANFANNNQPVIKVTTNYGVVTIGGTVATGDAHSNCIFKANGVDYAAADDNVALQNMMKNTAMEVDRKYIKTDGEKATYKVKSGSVITRVIKVDMQKAVVQDMPVNNTKELNDVLAAACTKAENTYTSSNRLNVLLNFDKEGNFELTDYEGLNAFVKKFGAAALELKKGVCTSNAPSAATDLKNINLNTSKETALKPIAGLASEVTITIPATSAITSVNGTQQTRVSIANEIINKKTFTVGRYATVTIKNTKDAVLNLTGNADCNVTLKDNTNGIVNYAAGATLNVDALNTAANYGKIAYTADSYAKMVSAMKAGVNQVTINEIPLGFFDQKIVAKDNTNYPADKIGGVGIEVIFNKCGDLKELAGGLEATTATLMGGTSCTDLTNCTVDTWNLSDTIAFGNTIAKANLNTEGSRKAVTRVNVLSGNVTINGIKATKLAVYAGANATLTVNAWAPANMAVEGSVTYNASGKAGDLKLDEQGNVVANAPVAANNLTTLVVTGNLTTNQDIQAATVWIGPKTTIAVNGKDVQGVAANTTVKATRYEQIEGTANFTLLGGIKQIWSGNTADWEIGL